MAIPSESATAVASVAPDVLKSDAAANATPTIIPSNYKFKNE